MVRECVGKGPALLIIKETQVRTMAPGMTTARGREQIILAKGWRKERVILYWSECKLVRPFQEIARTLLKQLEKELPYDPEILL